MKGVEIDAAAGGKSVEVEGGEEFGVEAAVFKHEDGDEGGDDEFASEGEGAEKGERDDGGPFSPGGEVEGVFGVGGGHGDVVEEGAFVELGGAYDLLAAAGCAGHFAEVGHGDEGWWCCW